MAGTDAGHRTFRVDRITSVERTGLPAVRPEGFDLEEAWRGITSEVDQLRTPVRATARVDPAMVDLCRWVFGGRVRIGPAGPDGRVEVEFRGQSNRSLVGQLAGFGPALEVVSPPEIRADLGRIGCQLAELYGSGSD